MRIAFCLVGIVGSVQGKYGLDGTTNSTKGLPVDFRIGHHFHKKHIFDHNDVDVFIHSWSNEFKDQLLDLYQPKKYIIEEQIDFKQNTHRMNSICSRWYSTAISVGLKKQYATQIPVGKTISVAYNKGPYMIVDEKDFKTMGRKI